MSQEYVFSSRNMFTSEVLRKGITITKSSGVLSLANATVTIYDASDGSVDTAQASATINGGDVYALVAAGTSTGARYAIFYAEDGTAKIKARLNYTVVQG